MYNPSRFKSTANEQAFEIMELNPFATVITTTDSKPQISLLPLVPRQLGNSIELIGHMARANPHWQYFLNAQTTALFHGAHTYITPQWYAENDVPTWNYSSVEVSGTVELIESYDGIKECLQVLTAHVERHWPSGWEFFVPEDLTGATLAKSIVGFKIKDLELNFKKKLSQNRSPHDRAGILQGLNKRQDENSKRVLADMLKIYSPDGELK